MITRNLRIALLESEPVWGDVAANLTWVRQQMQNIDEDTDLVVLPELFSTGMPVDRDWAAERAERNSGDTLRELQRLSRERHVAFAGSFLASTAAQLYNRAFFIEPNGEDTYYDKRHVFAPGGEDRIFNRGLTRAPIVRYRGMNIKLVVCYDLRFPVWCRNANSDYDVLLVVANWPKARAQAWRQLLIARALENEAFVCGVNRCGIDPQGVDYGQGSSLIIDFKGKVLAERAGSPIIEADLSPAALMQFRERFPAWRDADEFELKV